MKRNRSFDSESTATKKQQLKIAEPVTVKAEPKLQTWKLLTSGFCRNTFEGDVCHDIQNKIVAFGFYFKFGSVTDKKMEQSLFVEDLTEVPTENTFVMNEKNLLFLRKNDQLMLSVVPKLRTYDIVSTKSISEPTIMSCDGWQSGILIQHNNQNQFVYGQISFDDTDQPVFQAKEQHFPENKTPLVYVQTLNARAMITTRHELAAQGLIDVAKGWDGDGTRAVCERPGMRIDNITASKCLIIGWNNEKTKNGPDFWIMNTYLPKPQWNDTSYFDDKTPIFVDALDEFFVCVTNDHKLHYGCVADGLLHFIEEVPTQSDVYFGCLVSYNTVACLDKDNNLFQMIQQTTVECLKTIIFVK